MDSNIIWKLRQKCAERNIWTAAELQRLLSDQAGLNLSHTAVNKLMRAKPLALTLTTLYALCYVLKCTPSDLVEFDFASLEKFNALNNSEIKVANGSSSDSSATNKKTRVPAPPI